MPWYWEPCLNPIRMQRALPADTDNSTRILSSMRLLQRTQIGIGSAQPTWLGNRLNERGKHPHPDRNWRRASWLLLRQQHQDRIRDFNCCHLGYVRWGFQNGSSNRSCRAVWFVHRKNGPIITYKIIARRGLSFYFFNSAVWKGACRWTTMQSMEKFILSAPSWTRPSTVPVAKAPIVIITPIKPETVSAWPTPDLASSTRGFPCPWDDWKTSLMPSISMRPPKKYLYTSISNNINKCLPVPWVSTKLRQVKINATYSNSAGAKLAFLRSANCMAIWALT